MSDTQPHISIDDVARIARLARLALTEAEQEAMVGQLNDILESMSVLRTLDVSDVAPTAHVAPIPTPLRPDVVRKSLSSSEALQEAPQKADTSFVVPKIVG